MADQAEMLSDVGAILTGQRPDQEQPAEQATAPDNSPEPSGSSAESPADSQEKPTEGQTEGQPPPVETLKKAAERAGVSMKDLYAFEVPGTGATLGELKDKSQEFAAAEKRRTETEASLLDAENDLLRKNQALALAQQQAGVQVTEQHLAQMDQQLAEYTAHQESLLVRIAPELREPERLAAFKNDLTEYLNDYGYSPAEQQTHVDARLRKERLDHLRLKALLKDALESEKQTKPAPTKTARRSAPDARNDAVNGFKSGKLTQDQAVLKLLNSS